MSSDKKENIKTAGKKEYPAKAQQPEVAPILVHAYLRYLRMSPTKVRAVLQLIQGMSTVEALEQLYFNQRIAKEPITKLLESAVANAVNNFQLDKNNLYIKSFTADGGAIFERWRARAFGRAGMIRKRLCHLHVVLAEKVPTKKSPQKISADDAKKKDDIKVLSREEFKKAGKSDKGQGEGGARGDEIKKDGGKGFTKKLFNRKTG